MKREFEKKNYKEEKVYDDQVEGRNSVLELLESGKDINKIFIEKGERQGSIKEIIAKAKERKIIITELDRVKFKEMTQTSNPQGVIAVTPPFDYCEIYDIIDYAKEKGEPPFILILDGIEDPRKPWFYYKNSRNSRSSRRSYTKKKGSSSKCYSKQSICWGSRTYENCKG